MTAWNYTDRDCAEILVVDDTPESLSFLSEILLAEGYRVRPADTPELALESAKAAPPDLILLDVKMPRLNGFDLCELIKLHLPFATPLSFSLVV